MPFSRWFLAFTVLLVGSRSLYAEQEIPLEGLVRIELPPRTETFEVPSVSETVEQLLADAQQFEGWMVTELPPIDLGGAIALERADDLIGFEALSLSADGSRLLTLHSPRGSVEQTKTTLTAFVHEVPSGRRRSRFSIEVTSSPHNIHAHLSPDGTTACLIANRLRMLRVFDATTGTLLRTIVLPEGEVNSVRYSPDGKAVFVFQKYDIVTAYRLDDPSSEPVTISAPPAITEVIPGTDASWCLLHQPAGDRLFEVIWPESPTGKAAIRTIDCDVPGQVTAFHLGRRHLLFSGTEATSVVRRGWSLKNRSTQTDSFSHPPLAFKPEVVRLVNGERVRIGLGLLGMIEIGPVSLPGVSIRCSLAIGGELGWPARLAASQDGRWILARHSDPRKVRVWRCDAYPFTGLDRFAEHVRQLAEAEQFSELDSLYRTVAEHRLKCPHGDLPDLASVMIDALTPLRRSGLFDRWLKVNLSSIPARLCSALELEGRAFGDNERHPPRTHTEESITATKRVLETLSPIGWRDAPVQYFRLMGRTIEVLRWDRKMVDAYSDAVLSSVYRADLMAQVGVIFNHNDDNRLDVLPFKSVASREPTRRYMDRMRRRVGGLESMRLELLMMTAVMSPKPNRMFSGTPFTTVDWETAWRRYLQHGGKIDSQVANCALKFAHGWQSDEKLVDACRHMRDNGFLFEPALWSKPEDWHEAMRTAYQAHKLNEREASRTAP